MEEEEAIKDSLPNILLWPKAIFSQCQLPNISQQPQIQCGVTNVDSVLGSLSDDEEKVEWAANPGTGEGGIGVMKEGRCNFGLGNLSPESQLGQNFHVSGTRVFHKDTAYSPGCIIKTGRGQGPGCLFKN